MGFLHFPVLITPCSSTHHQAILSKAHCSTYALDVNPRLGLWMLPQFILIKRREVYNGKIQTKEPFFIIPSDGFCNATVSALRKSYSLEGESYCCIHSLSFQSPADRILIIISSANNFFACWQIHGVERYVEVEI